MAKPREWSDEEKMMLKTALENSQGNPEKLVINCREIGLDRTVGAIYSRLAYNPEALPVSPEFMSALHRVRDRQYNTPKSSGGGNGKSQPSNGDMQKDFLKVIKKAALLDKIVALLVDEKL